MCFVRIWEQTAIISLYSINWLVCTTETECVYCAVRTESQDKRLKRWPPQSISLLRYRWVPDRKALNTFCAWDMSKMALRTSSQPSVPNCIFYTPDPSQITVFIIRSCSLFRSCKLPHVSTSRRHVHQSVRYVTSNIFCCVRITGRPRQLSCAALACFHS